MKFVNHDFVPSDEETPLSKVMADMPAAAQAAAAKNTTGVYDNLSDRQLHTGTAFFYSFGGKKWWENYTALSYDAIYSNNLILFVGPMAR